MTSNRLKLIVCLLFFATGCASDSLVRFKKPYDGEAEIQRLIAKSQVTIEDNQFRDYVLRLEPKNIMSGKDARDGGQNASIKLNIKLDECRLEKPFYRNPKSILSVLTFSIVPFKNEYICRTSLEVENKNTNKTSKYFVELNYVLGFGAINSIVFGVMDSTILFSKKIQPIYVLLQEAEKDVQ